MENAWRGRGWRRSQPGLGPPRLTLLLLLLLLGLRLRLRQRRPHHLLLLPALVVVIGGGGGGAGVLVLVEGAVHGRAAAAGRRAPSPRRKLGRRWMQDLAWNNGKCKFYFTVTVESTYVVLLRAYNEDIQGGR